MFSSRLIRNSLLTGLAFMGVAGCNSCNSCNPCCGRGWGYQPGMLHARMRSEAIPDRYPLGSITRAPFHVMQTNAEATDFVLYRNDFVGETAELTPDGRDHVMEIAARMRSAPFPVVVERSENNTHPQLDADRRLAVAQVLYDLGNSDADQRTFVASPYSRGLTGPEADIDYSRYIFSRGGLGNTIGNNGPGSGLGTSAGAVGGGGFGGGLF